MVSPNAFLVGIHLLVIGFIPLRLIGQGQGGKRIIDAVKINTNLVIDGSLNEKAWDSSNITDKFIQYEPNEGAEATHDTKVRVLYNNEYLYFGIFNFDTVSPKEYRVPNLKRDFDLLNNDHFRVAIDCFNDFRNSFVFAVNPHGAQSDYYSSDGIFKDVEWDGLWYVKTGFKDSGWTAEFAIPWKTLRYKFQNTTYHQFNINFSRNRRISNEISVWSPIPRSISIDRAEYSGILSNLIIPFSSDNYRFQPYMSINYIKVQKGDESSTEKVKVQGGGDFKWAISQNTVVDLTVNTDFAQADADRPINNLSRFSILFPERRPFFLENSSLFSSGIIPINNYIGGPIEIRPFYSRSIGLDSFGNPVNIDFGARAIHRSKRSGLGFLYVRQSIKGNKFKEDFFVSRYSLNLGKGNRLGVLVGLKDSKIGLNNKFIGDYSGSLDGLIRLNSNWTLHFLGSVNLNKRSIGNGYAGVLKLVHQSNDYIGWVTGAVISQFYNPSTAFVSRQNVYSLSTSFSRVFRKSWVPGFIRSYEPGFVADAFWDFSKKRLQEASVKLWYINGLLNNGGGLFFFHEIYHQRIFNNSFSPLGISLADGNYFYHNFRFTYRGDASKRLFYYFRLLVGKYYNARYNQFYFNLSYSPFPYFSISPILQRDSFKGLGKNNRDIVASIFTLESRLSANPKFQLSVFVQKNSLFSSLGMNLRLAWEYRPLSFFYIVWNNRAFIQAERVLEQQLISKISYIKQF